VESGINWIDTAAVCGLGHSEEVAPASIRTEVEASLRRLRTERIDLYQMPWPAEDGTPLEEYWQVF
jgi:aryl-alcohol dehydrogenase-like predicted oxidoreductase